MHISRSQYPRTSRVGLLFNELGDRLEVDVSMHDGVPTSRVPACVELQLQPQPNRPLNQPGFLGFLNFNYAGYSWSQWPARRMGLGTQPTVAVFLLGLVAQTSVRAQTAEQLVSEYGVAGLLEEAAGPPASAPGSAS